MMQRMFIFLSLLMIIPDIYIYRMFIVRLTISPVWKLCYWIPSALLMIGLIYVCFLAGSDVVDRQSRAVGWFMLVVFIFAFPKVIFMLCSLLGLPFNYFLHWPKAPFVTIGLLGALLTAGMILYGATIGKFRFRVKEQTFYSPRLPDGFDGYRIALLTDIHIGSFAGNLPAVERMVDLINAQQADLMVFAGDLVNHRATKLNGFQPVLATLHARDGIYSVMGNHDYGPYYKWNSLEEQAENIFDLQQREADMGWTMLNNSHVILHHNNDSIALIGVENEGEPPFSQHADLPKAMEGTQGLFRILISHNPIHWRSEVLPDSDIDLMLAGHTHAMQLAWGHHSFSSLFYPEWGGLYMEGERGLYVSVGLGFVGLPFRFGAWPEVTVITLRKK